MLNMPSGAGPPGRCREQTRSPAMDSNPLWQLIDPTGPARLGLTLETSTDIWFAVAVIVTLWAYVLLAPGSRQPEA